MNNDELLAQIALQMQQGQTHGPRAKTYPPIDWSSLGRGALVGATTDVLGAPMDLFSNALRRLNIDIPDKVIPGTSDNLASKFTNLDYSPEEMAGRMAAGLAFPDVGDLALFGIFAGKSAKQADLTKLAEAMSRKDKGEDIREIYKNTGWFEGPDKKWRFEIDDKYDITDTGEIGAFWKTGKKNSPALINDLAESRLPQTNIGQVFSHEDLYKNYPDIKTTKLRLDDREMNTGSFNPSKNRITMSQEDVNRVIDPNTVDDINDPTSVALHELQHRLQREEGFPVGGSVGSIIETNPEWSKWQSRLVEAKLKNAELLRERTKLMSTAEYHDALKKEEKLNNEYLKIIKEKNSIKHEIGRGFTKDVRYKELDDIEKKLTDEFIDNEKGVLKNIREINIKMQGIEELKKTEPGKYIQGYEAYKRLAGEAEARAVQKRMNYTKAERRNKFPLDDYDVALEDLIFRYD